MICDLIDQCRFHSSPLVDVGHSRLDFNPDLCLLWHSCVHHPTTIWSVVCSKITETFWDCAGNNFPFFGPPPRLFIWERYNRLLNTFTPPTLCGFFLKKASLPRKLTFQFFSPFGLRRQLGFSVVSFPNPLALESEKPTWVQWGVKLSSWAESAIGKLELSRLPALPRV